MVRRRNRRERAAQETPVWRVEPAEAGGESPAPAGICASFGNSKTSTIVFVALNMLIVGAAFASLVAGAMDSLAIWVVLIVALFLTWQVRENSARQFDRLEGLVRESITALRRTAETRQNAPAEAEEEGTVEIEPLLRTCDPQGGEELLTAVLVQPTIGSPYASLWVSASLHITNNTDEMHEFTCQRMSLHWGDEKIDLEPVESPRWPVRARRAARVTTLSHEWTAEGAAILGAQPTLVIDLYSPTLSEPRQVTVRPNVYKSRLRPAFGPNGPVTLASTG